MRTADLPFGVLRLNALGPCVTVRISGGRRRRQSSDCNQLLRW